MPRIPVIATTACWAGRTGSVFDVETLQRLAGEHGCALWPCASPPAVAATSSRSDGRRGRRPGVGLHSGRALWMDRADVSESQRLSASAREHCQGERGEHTGNHPRAARF